MTKKYSNLDVINGGQVKYNPHKSTIAGVYKKFDQNTCNRYDLPARDITKKMLKDFVDDNPNIYEQDMIINNHPKYKFLELQVEPMWTDPEFPDDHIKIFVRKARYGLDTAFITFSNNLQNGYIFDRSTFVNCKPKRLMKYSKIFVYRLPIKEATYFFTEYLKPETFNKIKSFPIHNL